MAATVAAVRELPAVDRLVVVLAALEGKDVDGMLRVLRDGGRGVVTENTSPRRMPAAVLAARATELLGTSG